MNKFFYNLKINWTRGKSIALFLFFILLFVAPWVIHISQTWETTTPKEGEEWIVAAVSIGAVLSVVCTFVFLRLINNSKRPNN